MSANISFIEKILVALGHCYEEDSECLTNLLMKKLQDPEIREHPKLHYLLAVSPNCGTPTGKLTNIELGDLYDSLMLKSSALGVPEAMYETGNRLYEKKNFEAAIALYAKASQQGYAPALYVYGLGLYNGVGVEQDMDRGLENIKLSAGQLYEYALEFLIALFAKDDSPHGRVEHAKYSAMLTWAC